MGSISIKKLPIEFLPDVNYPVLSIETKLEGYSPIEVENLVTKPIEKQLSLISDIKNIYSLSKEGNSNITVTYEIGKNMDFSAEEIRSKLALIVNELPKDIRIPIVKKYNPSDAPIIILSIHSQDSKIDLRDFVENQISNPLKRINGVASVEMHGGKERELIIEIDPGRLRAYGLSLGEISNVIRNSNINMQTGSIKIFGNKISIRSIGSINNIDEIKNIAINTKINNNIIRVKDIGIVDYKFVRSDKIIRYQGKERILVYLVKDSNANTVNVSQSAFDYIYNIQKIYKNIIFIETVLNQAELILSSIKNLRNEAIYGAIFASIIIFLFLRNLISIIIVTISIPLSILSTFAFMYLTGINFNLISLLGITLGIGMLVDNAIVVMENTHQKISSFRYSSLTAALNGTSEVSSAITISTICHIVIFFPLIFLHKKIKIYYSGLFLTVSFSLLTSLIIAMTIVPLFCSKLSPHRIYTPNNNQNYLMQFYEKFLIYCLSKKYIVLIGTFILSTVTAIIVITIGFDQHSRLDKGEFDIILQSIPGTHIEHTSETARIVEKKLIESNKVEKFTTEIVGDTAKIGVSMVAKSDINNETRNFIEYLRMKIGMIPDVNLYFDFKNKNINGSKISIFIVNNNLDELLKKAHILKNILSMNSKLSDIIIHQENPKPEVHIVIDKNKAALYHITSYEIANFIRSVFTGPISTKIIKDHKIIDVRIRYDKNRIKESFSAFQQLKLPIVHEILHGNFVPLNEISKITIENGPSAIMRRNGNRVIEISALVTNSSISEVYSDINKKMLSSKKFDNDEFYFNEKYTEAEIEKRNMIFGFFLSVVFIFMLLASLFESYLTPLLIIVAVPLGLIGSIFALLISGSYINQTVYVGGITLIGIVVNNSIVLVDHIKFLSKNSKNKMNAVIEGSKNRLRPIIMTSTTTIFALLPMLIDKSSESSIWTPMAVTIIGGLITSTVMTLIILPVLFSIVYKD
jgi:HAE1 family hydrophobic/amphiphilic exporter-1